MKKQAAAAPQPGEEKMCIRDRRYTEDGGATWHELPGSTIVSMNMWGFTHSFLPEAEARFAAFLDDALKTNPLKGEYFLPSVVSQLVGEGKARVKVLHLSLIHI